MGKETDQALAAVERYYTSKLEQHGATARGVDWNGAASQETRFEQLLRVVAGDGFSINDLGCGYGALVPFLAAHYVDFAYVGVDLSERMIAEAKRMHGAESRAAFHVADQFSAPADYTLASGIFNVRPSIDAAAWDARIDATIAHMDSVSRKGFAFNCLTKYSDAEKMQKHLHYADPCRLFDLCKRRYSQAVALLHDYGLYEFTIIVRKGL